MSSDPSDAERDKAAIASSRRQAEGAVVRYDVAELLRGGREAVLEHNGAEYHLRITANGRLILTK